jgi:hypothetical protein
MGTLLEKQMKAPARKELIEKLQRRRWLSQRRKQLLKELKEVRQELWETRPINLTKKYPISAKAITNIYSIETIPLDEE